MTCTLFVDFMSQPSRACIIFARANNLKIDEKLIDIAKGQTRKAEFRDINPLGKLPVLKDGDFILPESAAILRYLATTRQVSDHWYPAEPQTRARVDSALDWYHTTLRPGAMGVAFNRVLAPALGAQCDEAKAEEAEQTLDRGLKTLEAYWLRESPFVAGQQISIADLLMVPEIEQLRVLIGAQSGKSMEEILAAYPGVRHWMAGVAAATQPAYDEAHAIIDKASKKFKIVKDRKAAQAAQAKL